MKKSLFISVICLIIALVSCVSSPQESKFGGISKMEYAIIQKEIEAAHKGTQSSKIIELSVLELAQSIKNRTFTSEEVTIAYLERICEFNPSLNAIVTIDAKKALERARAADLDLAKGIVWGPLHGVPFTIKDTYKTKDMRTTGGYLPLADYVPTENAVVVQRLLDAGAILMGKTNTPTLAMDMQTTNPIFGTTVNITNPALTAGGSSGGSSVAIAAKMTPFEFGTDLAGSIRLPAAFNGIFGLRPTFGLVSMRGHVPPKPGELDGIRRMATAGPLARNLSDLSLLLDIVGGPGAGDHRLDPIPAAPANKPLLKNLRVAWADNFGGVPVSNEIKEALELFAKKLEAAGVMVNKSGPADFPYEKAWETWGAFVGAQGGYDQSNFMRSLGDFFTKSAVAATPMQRKIVGPISVQSYMEAMKIQDDCIEQLENFLDSYDVWIVPVSSTTAFEHQKPTKAFGDFFVYDEPLMIDGAPVPYYVATQSYTTIFSLTESPVVTIPIGHDKKGAFIGVQIVGRRFADHRLLEIAQLLYEIIKN